MKNFHCNTSYVQIIWAICLVAWSGNNWSLCLCLWFPSLAFYLTCWIMNPTSVWVLTAVGAQVQVPSHYCSCNIILLLGWCDFITIKAQCLLTSCRQTTQVKFYCCQHGQQSSCMLVKTLGLTVNNLHRRYWANKTIFMFRYCCLTAVKHCTTRSVLFPNIIWLQKNFCAEQKKSIFCMPSACSMQSVFDLVHALLCHWTVNFWMFFVWRRHNWTICCDPTTIVDWGVVLTTTKVFIAETFLQ